MKQIDQLNFIEKINENGVKLLKSKGHDYAGEGDVLKNFKQMNEMCKILDVDVRTIEGTHLFYILLKIQRITNLLNAGKTAMNEGVQDTLIDLRNYTDLLNCTLQEKSILTKEIK